MAFPQYEYRNSLSVNWVRENDSRPKWIFRKNKKSSVVLSLDEEIYQLRCRLEQLVLEQRSLTSPEVVEISMMLDQKINEYINQTRGNR
ncbi:aspartyl-phosphate phosphatase Spo0E family protein [Paenibacillus xerothermodurans]|uniref:Aspartyl-phosphate phosphatase Spo0E family protein n=1 Tax=Paenibacillus xerothermodurans TaxID=1977292 RepID=A0A2W1NAX3_PAEXE|nr:aspartyl-phosphate phosphatase Spo0E family protein [Paenibacillus xerothermodurans]PZE20381.1 aspartyl-phosphate phosphatase Spo0E family protein [Paenibacillus xerothermodurans]